MEKMKIIVTGGAGFIGSNFILDSLKVGSCQILNFDKLTYSGNLKNLESVQSDSNYRFVRGDITDEKLVERTIHDFAPDAIVHFAAESHVDRSISGPKPFLDTNVGGTFNLLEAARKYWLELSPERKLFFRFLHVSTDEVFGSLEDHEKGFTEQHRFQPNSPYSASKAAADHFARAYHKTFGLPVLITNCSNNYGPYHFPEKLIPLVILNALEGKPLPVYGDGQQVRDWLYVVDHCRAITLVLARGRVGETYNIGGGCEMKNLDVVKMVCDLIDEKAPNKNLSPRQNLIRFVPDRPGHDHRYAIDFSKIKRELDWQPSVTFEQGLKQTVDWFLNNMDWVNSVRTGEYRKWIESHYVDQQRL